MKSVLIYPIIFFSALILASIKARSDKHLPKILLWWSISEMNQAF